MKRFLKFIPHKITRKHNLLFSLLIPVVLIIYNLPNSYPQLTAQLQNNILNPLGDFLIVIVAILGMAGLAFFGTLGSWLYERMFEVAPQAMLQIHWPQLKALFLLVKFFNFVFRLFTLLRPSTLNNLRPMRSPDRPPVKLKSQTAIPYQLFPTTCVLLN